MVWIVDDWEDFMDKAGGGRGLGTYQIRDVVKGEEIRIKCGKLGYVGVYKNKEAYENILNWLSLEGFILIKESIPDEVFHL